MTDSLAQFIRESRDARGFSQKYLAALVGIPQPALSDIERGKVKLPNADLRRRLAAALNVRHIDMLVAAGELSRDELAIIETPDALPASMNASLTGGLLGIVWEWTQGHPDREHFLLQMMGNLKD